MYINDSTEAELITFACKNNSVETGGYRVYAEINGNLVISTLTFSRSYYERSEIYCAHPEGFDSIKETTIIRGLYTLRC